MKITKLEINNFLMIGHAVTGLDERGLVLIQGENNDDTSQDSNGSGKSSFADAISWSLYGFTARGESGDAVVNRTAKKECSVAIEIADETGTFRISRHRKHKLNSNRLIFERIDVEPILDLTLGTDKATQESINKVMGCSEDVFKAAVYMGQEQMPDLPSMTDKFLKQLIEEAAGVDKLQEGHTIARNRLNEVRVELNLITSQIDAEKRVQENAQETLTSTLASQLNWALGQTTRIESKITDLRELKAVIDGFDSEAAKGQLARRASEIEAIDAEIAGFGAEKTRERELVLAYGTTTNKVSALESELRMGAGQLRTQKEAAEKVSARVGTPCGECGKAYEEHDIEHAFTLASTKVEDFKKKVGEINNRYKEAKELAEQAGQILETHRASMTDVSAKNEQRAELGRRLNATQTVISEHISRVASLAELATDIRAMRVEENPHALAVKMNEEKLESIKLKIETLEGSLAAIEKKVAIHDAVVKVFGPAGVRAHILDTVTPFLNERTAHYLSTLTDGNVSAVWQTITPTKAGELREKFSIEASSLVGAASFKGMSGGEKRKVRLSCAMALQDLVASRATKPIELFVADEIDDALDSSGLERLMGILEEKSRSRGTVLVISHNSLSDWIRQSVTVVKESGKSIIKGSALECLH